MFPSFIDTFKNLFRQDESGFKVSDDGKYWFARYSNAFEDREGEYFPQKAIDRYVERVDSGVVPAPELWIWHEPIVVGKAYTVARIDNFAVAVGYFHETPVGQAAKVFLKTHKAKLSHGFIFNPEAFKDNAYHDYNTFEISVLPFNKNVEANAYTNIEVKDMTLTPEKEAFFKELFGEEKAKELVATTSKASKALEDAGTRYKEFVDISRLRGITIGDAETPETEATPETPAEGEAAKTKAVPMLIADLYKDVAEIADGQNAIASALVEIKKSFNQNIEANKVLVQTLQSENKALRDELGLTPKRASQSPVTVVTDRDLQQALDQKQAVTVDSFYAPFLDRPKN